MALMIVSQALSRLDVESPDIDLSFPDSVVDMMRGNLGQPPGGFPKSIVGKILKGEKPNLEWPGKQIKEVDHEQVRTELSEDLNYGGNCCEHYITTDQDGVIYNLGGEWPWWSTDRGLTWTEWVPPVVNNDLATCEEGQLDPT